MPSRARRDILGFKGDECDCGRRASILHCNACGSTRVYSRSNREHTHLNGEVKFVKTQYKCQTCGHEFIQEERQFCDAPPVSEALARLKVQRLTEAAERGEYLDPKDQKIVDALRNIQVEKLEREESKIATVEDLEKTLPTEVVNAVNEMPRQAADFVPPVGLQREEYDRAEKAFRLEWVNLKLYGQDPGITADEYVKRKLNGEVFE